MIRAIVLAAGKGTRMKSTTPKVLHELCGRPMLWYVVRSLRDAGVEEIVVVTNDELQPRIAEFGVRGIVQKEQLGTGHAVKVALDELESASGQILVAYGDMPLVHADVYRAVLACLEGNALAMVTARMPLPSNFGRVIRRGEHVDRIVEVRDANPDELLVNEMNAGIYAYDEALLRESVAGLRNDNAQSEYYLTDTIADLVRGGKNVVPVVVDDHVHVLGINDRTELAIARRELNRRICAKHMREGVTIIDPETTYLEPELRIGRDVVIYPNTTISRLSEIGSGSIIGPNARLSAAKIASDATIRESVILDSTIGNGVTIGPFAHLRNETVLEDGVHVGNFVEVKNSHLGAGVKAGHLTYLGDAEIGENTNVGAGTITCNYDGVRKNRTTVGRDAFIGSNTSLVAPVNVGDGALTGASAVVTKDVPAGGRVAGNPARPLPVKEPHV